LLRLLLPLNDKVQSTSPQENFKYLLSRGKKTEIQLQRLHRTIQSVGATGGVYKGQGRIRRGLMNRAYEEFLVDDPQLQGSIPSTTEFTKIAQSLFRPRSPITKNTSSTKPRKALQKAHFNCYRHRSLVSVSVARVRPRTSEGHHRPVIASIFHSLA